MGYGYVGRRRGVRWNKDTQGFEMWCPDCHTKRGHGQADTSWWPLTDEFWYTSRSLIRCRACYLEYERQGFKARKRLKAEEFVRAHPAGAWR